MTRNIWHAEKLRKGQVIDFKGAKYLVLSQSLERRSSYHFGPRYYTTLKIID